MNQSDPLPLLGITMGDPGGVGPEVCAKALAEPKVYTICRPLIIGDAEIMANAVSFCGLNQSISRCRRPDQGQYRPGTIDVLDLSCLSISELRHQTVTAAQGRASFTYIERAVELALAGDIDGTVTAPISKAAINAAGYHYSGHTEIYGALTGATNYAMMLADGNFRVTHVSTHVSLREACNRVKKKRVLTVINLTDRTLKRLGIEHPRIAVAGLNPHCGEGGLFGDEDEREIAPAVSEAQAAGLTVEGPLPADTVFSKMAGGLYDSVVVMYHDQGHIPAKLVGFHYDEKTDSWDRMAGVNLTLGLPIIRTSVDHGTAYDRAGEGRANPQSLIESIRLAARLARPANI
ncbi:4-hydroxythreonine-4-phosphate dehydrogenase PdxA [Desulfofustis limnaeus]|uniref:4-hydroxythreonine-4-phosphate dehydrogenase n=1 Tax=Desulfofustis limnaeus TaxID=2740163 RepID=A0ABM7W552_9BACT|nr:4-hydroxythreonine-4-phosphate dehydrogenase PdxA [Desulfofustis limnaeus]BDD86047.1 4-hydroxythreonine-4-phosphate dehydrogenase [Desulfofustis limnaeus]